MCPRKIDMTPNTSACIQILNVCSVPETGVEFLNVFLSFFNFDAEQTSDFLWLRCTQKININQFSSVCGF